MKKIISLILIICLCFGMMVGLTSCDSEPDRVHIYGNIILGDQYVRGNVCFKITNYDKNTNRVKILGIEQYGWITLFNYNFYKPNESCPYCGRQYANIY
jgi:hypothetical protein